MSSNGPSPQSSYGFDQQSPARYSNYTSGSVASPSYLNVYSDVMVNAGSNVSSNTLAEAPNYDPQPPDSSHTTAAIISGTTLETALPNFMVDGHEFHFEQLLYPVATGIPSQRQESLTEEQQAELMATVEKEGMQDITQLLTDSENFFKTLSTP